MTDKTLSKYKTLAKAFKFGLWGMAIGFLWALFSLIGMIVFEGTILGKILRVINAPLLYQVCGRFYDFLVELGLANVHDAIRFYLITLIIYSLVGCLLGLFYFVCYIHRKNSSEIRNGQK